MQLSSGGTAYLSAIQELLPAVAERNRTAIAAAAGLIADAVGAGGVVQAFGTGHSEAFAMEVAGRAGGLVPTNRLTLRDPVLLGAEPPEFLKDPALERDPGVIARLLELAPLQPGDLFMIASNSGVNGAVVELALRVRERGHPVIAVTSIEHTTAVTPKHPSGRRLAEIADVVLDNGAPYGDAVLPLPGGGSMSGVSSITSALLAQMAVADAVRVLIDRSVVPPVYLSANVPGGDEHNAVLEARYPGRLRRIP
ncbi:sugar isomerase domain-containing protein [Kribbella sp. GL6]|uniref:sugar isomerase domain-containing protein n=1 Tax=Kribbella sp. GL6 TaxID=3419765 RepID=UPI003D0739B3